MVRGEANVVSMRISRRRLLGLAGASAAGAAGTGLAGRPGRALAAGHRYAAGPLQTFVSRPDLKVPPVKVRHYGGVSPSRYIFLDVPYSGPGGGGAMIIDSDGRLVWFGPNTATEHKLDFNTQMLDGEPVLTWWQGIVVQGHGEGEVAIADSSYQVKRIITAHGGVKADLHEFVITPQNTAIISAYRRHSHVDLTAIGGPASGSIFSGVFQEIDVATGTLLFEWDSYDPANPPVAITDTYLPLAPGFGTAAPPFDHFHINSIDTDANGDYIVSGRHTWTIYKISRADGSIQWRMNGKSSDFTMGTGATFAWQHHVRPHGHGQLTIFDNGATPQVAPAEPQSRALVIAFDEVTMQARLVRALVHPGARVLAKALGSAQILPGNEMFVDWGAERRFSQFGAEGKLLLDAQMVPGASSYRGFSKPWTGHPVDLPAVAARYRSGGATVYASWNGATEVASWTVLAGASATSLTSAGSGQRTGFETAVAVSRTGPYFAVQARSATGALLATSKAVRIS